MLEQLHQNVLEDFLKNSYNIITIENGKIQVDLKVVSGQRTPLQDITKNYARFEDD